MFGVTTFTRVIPSQGIGMYTWYLAKLVRVRYIQSPYAYEFFVDYIDSFQTID